MVETAAELCLSGAPAVNVGMLIRRPVEEVFEAFVDPAITSKFWFTGGSGRLGPGARVRWEWAMYGASADVRVTAFEEQRRIAIEWGSPGGDDWTSVEWTFDSRPDGTLVNITNQGFKGNGDEVCAAACDAMQGFAFTLAAAKAYLEHGIQLNVVADHFPDAHVEGWQEKGA